MRWASLSSLVVLSVTLTACKPGVYYPFGHSPKNTSTNTTTTTTTTTTTNTNNTQTSNTQTSKVYDVQPAPAPATTHPNKAKTMFVPS